MPFLRTITLTSVLALSAGPALADLTPTEVWDDWQSLLSRYGAELSFDRTSNEGDRLSVIGLTAAFPVTEGSSSWDLGTLIFEQNSDGSVSILMEDDLPLSIDLTNPDGEEGTVGFTIRQPDASLTASGSIENLTYDFNYPTIEMTDFTIEGPDVPDDFPVEFTFTMSALEGFVNLIGTETRTYESVSALGLMSMVMNFQGATPEEGSGKFNLSMKDLSQTTNGTIGQISGEMSLAELIGAGTTQVGTATHGEVTFDLDVDSPSGSFQLATAAVSGEINGTLDENGISYGGVTNDVTMSIAGSSIPLPPLTFRLAQSSGQFSLPIVPRDDAQPFALKVALNGLEIDPMLWSMFDPGEQLSREPITLVIDTSGNVVVTEDFTSPEYAESQVPSMPGSVEDVTVNTLQLTIAGAELTGDGAFTFDNSTPVPAPVGVANLMLTGGNGLLDTLVGMGLVPEDQATGLRMMLGLFARPGEGEDTLQSTIEVKEDGSVLANGQRIR